MTLSGAPADETIYLAWDVVGVLLEASTWQIRYAGPPGDQPSPITGLPGLTRAFTLNAMLDSTPILTATATAMPTDISIHLPAMFKGP